MSSKNSETPLKDRIDWITVIVPFLAILALCVCFILMPDASKSVLDTIRFILGDTFGLFYLAVGLFVFLLSLFLAFSRFGNIRLGKPDEKPKYPLFVWASMMFTSGLAADILFYSFCEWILYANDPHISEMGSMQTWSSTYPLFHWGPIPWAFYLVLAVCFGFMLHVRGCHKQKYSEACRALLGNKVDGLPGKLIDLLALAVIALARRPAHTSVSQNRDMVTLLLVDAIGHLVGRHLAQRLRRRYGALVASGQCRCRHGRTATQTLEELAAAHKIVCLDLDIDIVFLLHLSASLNRSMILVSFHIHCAEGTRGTQILARSATYAALDINRRDFARAAVARLQRHHSDGQ